MSRAVSEIQGWFEPAMPAEDLEKVTVRMMERGWLAPHPVTSGAFVLTDEGDEVIELAFKGLVRFVDAGEGRWDMGRMFQIIKTSYDRRRN